MLQRPQSLLVLSSITLRQINSPIMAVSKYFSPTSPAPQQSKAGRSTKRKSDSDDVKGPSKSPRKSTSKSPKLVTEEGKIDVAHKQGGRTITSAVDPGTEPAEGSNADKNKHLDGLSHKEMMSLIDSCNKTAFQRQCYKCLLQIPEGQFSTYAAMSKYLASSPRAVGNAMRENPFAPRVPCHRVLAADRTIGGFKGDWGVRGKYFSEKIRLLTSEGVKFDSKGKVVGPVFTGFHLANHKQ